MVTTFDKLIHLQKLLWKGDDRIDQGDLFEAQAELADLLWRLADQPVKRATLIRQFPWLYNEEGIK